MMPGNNAISQRYHSAGDHLMKARNTLYDTTSPKVEALYGKEHPIRDIVETQREHHLALMDLSVAFEKLARKQGVDMDINA